MSTDTKGAVPSQQKNTPRKSSGSANPASITDLPLGAVTFTSIENIEKPKNTPVDIHKQQLQKETEHFPLPQGYGDNRIVLLVRDPRWVYAYWEITKKKRDELRQMLGTDTWQESKFILRVYDVTDVPKSGTLKFFDIQIDEKAMNWYIHVPAANRCYRVDLGILTPHNIFYTIATSNAVTTPREGISEIIDEQWMIVEEEFKRLYLLASGFADSNSSIEMIEAVMKRQHLEMMGSEAIAAVSSPVFFEQKAQPFWLVAHTELIVHGATEPNAKVTIQGETIQLRADGTFTARFALPEGKHEIHIKGTSHDEKQTHSITPVIYRETRN
jgi:hypothetical protein